MPESSLPSWKGGTEQTELLAATFVELADSLVDDFDVVDLLHNLGDRCVELFDASAAGMLLADADGTLRLMAATSETMEFVEIVQLQSSEGPCLECFETGHAVEVADLASALDRWPNWAPVAVGAGFCSAHAFPLRLRGQVLGALNLFSVKPGRLAPQAVVQAQALADVATIAVLQHRAAIDAQDLSNQLQFALNSRIAIEQAKGIIAQSAHVGMDEAFVRLRGYARSHSRQLSEVAQEVIDLKIRPSDLVPPGRTHSS